MKKVLACVLALVLCLGLLAGCGSDKKDSGNSNGSGSATVDDSVFFTGKINYKTDDGDAVYRIIRPEGDSEIMAVASTVLKSINKSLGISMKNQTDGVDGNDAYEILIGETNRPETATAKQYLKQKVGGRYEDIIVCSIGKKIVIYSQSVERLSTAADYFVNNFVKAEGVDGGVCYIEAAKGNFENISINGVSVGEFTIVRPHFNSSYLTELEMNALIEKVYTASGYMLNIVHDEYAQAGKYEIVVGNSSREGVNASTDLDEYTIKVSGDKVYLNGGSAHSTAMAVSEFAKLLKGDVTDAASVNGSYNTTIATYDATNTLRYTWGDDFNGNELDTTKWYQSTEKESGIKGENGKTSVRSSNPNDVFLADGKFHICARQDESYYYGGRITTQKNMRYKYGYIEMSAVIPHGSDFWVALWVCGDAGNADAGGFNMYPEIDIVECFGNSAMYYANCHKWPTSNGESAGLTHTSLDNTHANEKKYQCPDDKLLTNDFHTYGMMWTETEMTFVCDGDAYFTYKFDPNSEDINTFNQEMYILISMALGFDSNTISINDATADDWANTNKYIVDYINIYQKNDGKSYVRAY